MIPGKRVLVSSRKKLDSLKLRLSNGDAQAEELFQRESSPPLGTVTSIGSLFIVACLFCGRYTGDLTCVDDGRAVRPVPIIAVSIIFRITRE